MPCAVVTSRPGKQLTHRVLVVDDEPGMRRSLAIMLRGEGYQVAEAATVAEAMGRLKGERYDLIVADLAMEPLDGLDLLVLARRHQPGCPVIIVTAFGAAETRSEALGLGAVAFLEKPLQVEDLVTRVREILAS